MGKSFHICMEHAALKRHLNHHARKGKKGSVHIAMATNLTTIQKVMEISMGADKNKCKNYEQTNVL